MSGILALNVATILYLCVVTVAVVISNRRNTASFYVLSFLLLIPIFAQVRQLLVLNDLLQKVPLYLLMVYILLRLIGPLINLLVHLQVKKKYNFLSWINITTYFVFGYIIYMGFRFMISESYNTNQMLLTFKEDHVLAWTYPVLQLLHVGEALFILHNSNGNSNKALHQFMKASVLVVTTVLVVLQLSYFVFDRFTVEHVVAPIVFLNVYSAIIFISFKYSTVFNSTDKINLPELTERENDVLHKLVIGKTDKEIADELHLSVNTVATYCRRIYQKLEVKNRTEAARKFLQKN